jgi:AcrR family transcriptional regulator
VLIRKRGFAGMSVRQLAGDLAFSKANFYNHVSSKEQLLYEIFVETLNLTIRALEEILRRGDSPHDKLRAIVDFYVHLMRERTDVMIVWFNERHHLTPEHQAETRNLEHQIGQMLSDFTRQGVARGDFVDIDPRVSLGAIFGMCFGLARGDERLDHLSIRKISAQIQGIVCGGLLHESRR